MDKDVATYPLGGVARCELGKLIIHSSAVVCGLMCVVSYEASGKGEEGFSEGPEEARGKGCQ